MASLTPSKEAGHQAVLYNITGMYIGIVSTWTCLVGEVVRTQGAEGSVAGGPFLGVWEVEVLATGPEVGPEVASDHQEGGDPVGGHEVALDPLGVAAPWVEVDPVVDLLQEVDPSEVASPQGGLEVDPSEVASPQGGLEVDPSEVASPQGGLEVDPSAVASLQGGLEVDPSAVASPQGALEVDPSEVASPQGALEVDPSEVASPQGVLEVDPSEVASPQGGLEVDLEVDPWGVPWAGVADPGENWKEAGHEVGACLEGAPWVGGEVPEGGLGEEEEEEVGREGGHVEAA